MRICGDGYKPFSVLNSIFFLYSCIFNSDVNTRIRDHWFFFLSQAIAWEALHGLFSAGGVNTVEQMPRVRKNCARSQIYKFVTPCLSSSFQTSLGGGCPRDLLWSVPPCVGTCGGKEQGGRLAPCAVGCPCCREKEEVAAGLLAVEVSAWLVNLYAA